MAIHSLIEAPQRDYTLSANSWTNRTVLITGASGGLGSALCRHLAGAGATVILMGKHQGRLNTLYDELVEAGAAEPAIIEQDFTQTTPEMLQATADVIAHNFERLDALIHTAATLGELSPITHVDDKKWREAFDVNLHAARDLTMACLPLLKHTTNSSVVFTLDEQTSAYWGGYGVSKTALGTLLSIMADENEHPQTEVGVPSVSFHGVLPGPMRTRLRRRAFSGELEQEAPLPETQVGAFLYCIDRVEPTQTGNIWHNEPSV